MDHTQAELTTSIRQRALNIGFSVIGVSPAVTPPGYSRLLTWLDAGYAADMTWIDRRREAYERLESVMSGTKSIIVAGLNYHDGIQHSEGARVSRYAWSGIDYHTVMRSMLRALADSVSELHPGIRTRCVVDTAPVLERDFARLAGVGWFGKNTMLISRKIGSWFFLGAVLTDVTLDYDQPFSADHCGTCTRCLDACPTNAFPEPGVLDAGRCISYLTIEQRSRQIPEPLRRGMGTWLFGCDICQDVCPWNRFAPAAESAAFSALDHLNPADCTRILHLSDDEYRKTFGQTALARPGRAAMARNAAIVLGNLADTDSESALCHALLDPAPIVRGAAAWALGQLDTKTALMALRVHRQSESDESVQQEIDAVLRNRSASSAVRASDSDTI
jgi:epoxyqueuosine reductase